MTTEETSGITVPQPPAEPPHPEEPTTPGSDGPIAFSFVGQGKEFFGIWLVNLILTALTVGLYIPWARVRERRFFYENTWIGKHAFDYLADPRKIFRVFVFVLLAFIGLSVLDFFAPYVAIAIWYVALPIAIPWLILKVLRFRARNSANQGIRFSFQGEAGQAYFVYLWGLVASVLSLGIAYPWFVSRQHRFLANHHRFGQQRFAFRGRTRSYYRIFARFGLALLPGALLIALAIFISFQTLSTLLPLFVGACGALAILYAFSFLRAGIFNYRWSHTLLKKKPFDAYLPTKKLFQVSLTNSLLTAVTLGLFYPFAKVRLARLHLDHLDFSSKQTVEAVMGQPGDEVGALGEASDAMLDFDIG